VYEKACSAAGGDNEQDTAPSPEEADTRLRDIVAGRRDFWALAAEIGADELSVLLDRALSESGGSPERAAELFGIRRREHRRFAYLLRAKANAPLLR
jgi:hypothetical protein